MNAERLSRRQLAGLAATAFAARAQTLPLTASMVVERIKRAMAVQLPATTVDKYKAGNPDTPVKAIATTFMATLDVLQRAAAMGANFVISHEPTFWNHQDIVTSFQDDPVFRFKTAFIEKNNMVVWRLHDGIHAHKPDMIFVGFDKAMGWEKYRVAGNGLNYVIPPTTVEAIARQMAARLKTRSIRLIGDHKLPVTKVTMSGHNALDHQGAFPDCDVQILFEAWERDSSEYVRDTVASGQRKALILTAHEVGEEDGMDVFADWLRKIVTEVPIHFIRAGDQFWIA
jgi:putative NIF3 family GTP cyclohydrolase 1 type 2